MFVLALVGKLVSQITFAKFLFRDSRLVWQLILRVLAVSIETSFTARVCGCSEIVPRSKLEKEVSFSKQGLARGEGIPSEHHR